LAGAMLLTGTFAWSSISQRATNPIDGYTPPPIEGGRIHDHFDGRNKDVFAENFGNEPLLVRIQLREFMSVDNVSFSSTATRDNYMSWDVHIPTTRVDLNSNADLRRFRSYVSWTMGGQTVFMPTFNQNPDCLQTETSGDGIDYVVEDQTAAGSNDGSAGFWGVGETETATRTYIDADGNLATGTATHTARNTLAPEGPLGVNIQNGVILMSDWIARGRPTGNFWVIDEEDGWAYWASLLQPGEATSLLLDAISINPPVGEWFYAIHVIGEFAGVGSVGDWENSPFGAPSDPDGEDIIDRILNTLPMTVMLGETDYLVLSNTMGPGGHGTGSDFLVMTANIYAGPLRWHYRVNVVGGNGYQFSEIRNGAVLDFFNSQTWAHDLAILPDSSMVNGLNLPNNAVGADIEFTVSTGTMMSGLPNNYDGAFLLSYADMNTFFFTNESRLANNHHVEGVHAGYWLRGFYNGVPSNVVRVITMNGGMGGWNGIARGDVRGIRPAMILTELPISD